MKRFKILLISLVITIIAVSVSAGGQKEPADVTQLNISYVKSPFNLQVMVLKERQMLEKAFAPEGITIKWHEINSGAKQAEAMAAGSLDIASVMNTASVIIANSAGNEIDIIDIVSRPEQTFAVMVMDDGPRSVKDLSHCVVAGPKGTVLHQMLAAIEEKENLEDVQLVSMSLPQSQAALISKNVDAALLAGSLIIKTQNAGGRVLTTSEGYVTPLLVSASPRRFAQNHPEIIDHFTSVQQQAYTFIQNNLSQAIAIGARAQNLDSDEAKDLYNRSGIASSFTADDLSGLARDIAFLRNLNMIENDLEASEMLGDNLNVH
ncbi:ABC-type transporter, substrate-binding protein [Desulforapulum autotrophicum HRM2]|uniref:ABC-type transporter, substrate-binding protein n=1 Tax=Desulforapulum autotrophicum (strain ATCC 43914 / DSM 3382 / VKM B-1955 / HRM2) TaxID=177437 RepID=C0QEG1_DESAH|nr:NrtA/SsuA/CpmA family ABC transporter substrate-binding protein [Desulforapulum autotrophicum]ACN13278.1 ABC-type transporter, substrate-binding protein [Desulforapulum autotrophicum HRM2]